MRHSQRHSGFHSIELGVTLVVVGIIAAVGFFVFRSNQGEKQGPNGSDSTADEVVWSFDERNLAWIAKGTSPACKEPVKFDLSPVDMSLITNVLLPGSYRGFNYKPHGGFGLPESSSGNVEVKMPMDATLVGLTRYYEGATPPDLQYLLTFESDCGIAFRFDHLHTLTPEFQALAEQTPEPKLNDTRTSPDDNPPRTKFTAGQVIATRVGLPSMSIYGFDFGVYDYRQRNEISKNTAWAAIHNQHQSLEWFGVCWYDMLPGDGPELAKQLSLAQTDTRRTVPKVSDYCPHAPHKTLEFNQGKPTDG